MVAPHFSVWLNGKALTSYQHKSLFCASELRGTNQQRQLFDTCFCNQHVHLVFPGWLHHRSSHPLGRKHSQFHHQPVTLPRDWKYSSRRILADSAVSKPKFSTMNLQMTCSPVTTHSPVHHWSSCCFLRFSQYLYYATIFKWTCFSQNLSSARKMRPMCMLQVWFYVSKWAVVKVKKKTQRIRYAK